MKKTNAKPYSIVYCLCMQSTIFDFPTQLKWQPMVEGGTLPVAQRYVLCGMGGSALAGDLLTACDSSIPITTHRDYGLPIISAAGLDSTLIIAASFSGNTEETLEAYDKAREAGLPLIAITAGGELLSRARRDGIPHIIFPDAIIPPRLAGGYFLKALALITEAKGVSNELESLGPALDRTSLEAESRTLAERLAGRIPLFYSSGRYAALAYFWKIMMNETAKIPAFSNTVPEHNHNELASFGAGSLIAPFTAVILVGEDDPSRVTKRFALLTEILPSLNVPVEKIFLTGVSPTARVIHSVLLATLTAIALAETRGVDPSATPVIEDFKSKLKII